MIIKPITKIKITSSPLKCTPGSLGYLVTQNQYLGYNIWSRLFLLSRVGKTGKDRLEVMCIRDTMVDYKSLRMSDAVKMLKSVELAESIHPRLNNLDNGRKKPKYSHYADHTKFEIVKNEHKDALNMPVWEFITYTAAISAFMYSIHHGESVGRISQARLLHTDSRFQSFPTQDVNPYLMWLYLIHGLKLDRTKKTEYESSYREFFDVPENRIVYMTGLRESLASMVGHIKNREKFLKRSEQCGRNNLKDILNYYRKHSDDYRDRVKRSKSMVKHGPDPDSEVKSVKEAPTKKKTRLRRA